jgi:hypothetical protein
MPVFSSLGSHCQPPGLYKYVLLKAIIVVITLAVVEGESVIFFTILEVRAFSVIIFSIIISLATTFYLVKVFLAITSCLLIAS